MATVFIPHQMRDLTGGEAQVEVAGKSIRQLIAALDAQYPGLAERLLKGDQMAPGLAVSIDGAISPRGPLAAVGPQSEVHILPAIGGG